MNYEDYIHINVACFICLSLWGDHGSLSLGLLCGRLFVTLMSWSCSGEAECFFRIRTCAQVWCFFLPRQGNTGDCNLPLSCLLQGQDRPAGVNLTLSCLLQGQDRQAGVNLTLSCLLQGQDRQACVNLPLSCLLQGQDRPAGVNLTLSVCSRGRIDSRCEFDTLSATEVEWTSRCEFASLSAPGAG